MGVRRVPYSHCTPIAKVNKDAHVYCMSTNWQISLRQFVVSSIQTTNSWRVWRLILTTLLSAVLTIFLETVTWLIARMVSWACETVNNDNFNEKKLTENVSNMISGVDLSPRLGDTAGGRTAPIFYGTQLDPDIQHMSKFDRNRIKHAEKNSGQTNKQTNRQTLRK